MKIISSIIHLFFPPVEYPTKPLPEPHTQPAITRKNRKPYRVAR